MTEVAAGVVLNVEKRILLCQRQGELNGLWEFPGGKREAGESFAQCLARELWEELRLAVTVERELCRMHYRGEGKEILFSFLCAKTTQGSALELLVHSGAQWVAAENVSQYSLCPADAQFVREGGLKALAIRY